MIPYRSSKTTSDVSKKRKLKLLFTSFLFLTLIVPSHSALFYKTVSPVQAVSSGSVEINMVVIKVAVPVSQQPVSVIKPNSAIQAGVGCFGAGPISSGNLVQEAGIINLNQPAGCFSLQSHKQERFEFLTVRPLLKQNGFIVVVDNTVQINSGYAAHNPGQTVPIAPVAQVIFGGIIIFLFMRLPTKTKVSVASFLPFRLKTAQLQVLRC